MLLLKIKQNPLKTLEELIFISSLLSSVMVRTEAFGMKICIAYVTHRENKNVEKRSINFH